jgi:hypothetical protein
MKSFFLSILVVTGAASGAAYGQDLSARFEQQTPSASSKDAEAAQAANPQTEKGAALEKLFDRSGKAHRLYRDWNGTPRTTDFLLENAIASEASVSAASSVVFMPQLTGAVSGGRGQEVDAVLFFPKIIRPSKGSPAPTISGVAIAAPIDGGGSVPALDAATLRIESNPPAAMGTKSWALAIDAGDVKIGNHIYFPDPSGVQQGRGDMVFNNLDTSPAGTISFYSDGTLRMRIQPSGLLSLPNGVSVGGGESPVTGIYRVSKRLAYAAIAGQSCEEQEMDMVRARPSGTAMASPAESLGSGNLVWSAWVNEIDKVRVRVCNPTSGSITPNAIDWNVTVIQ